MITKKTKILAAVVIAVGLITVGIGTVRAATNTNGRLNFMSNMVNAIAQKFNLSPTAVQQVFDDQAAQQKSQMTTKKQQSFTDRLNKAVTDGKLTQDQVNKIIAEKTSVDAQMAALKGKTGTDLKTAMKQITDSAKQWATDNKIPQQYLMFGFRGSMDGGRGGFGTMRSFKGHGKPTTTPTPQN